MREWLPSEAASKLLDSPSTVVVGSVWETRASGVRAAKRSQVVDLLTSPESSGGGDVHCGSVRGS